jgi:hypothetical protein
MWPFSSQKKESGIPLTQAVRDKIEVVFEADLRAEASDLIQKHCGFSLPLMQTTNPDDYDRIRFAVIRLSEGSLETLRELIGEAHKDWRNVLNGAGFAWDVEAHLHWNPKSNEEAEQCVAPNRSLPPTLNSTSSVRGSEDL